MSKKLVIASLMALCMFLIVCMSATAAEPEDLSGNWIFHWQWLEPPPPSDWQETPITITMNTPFSGTIEFDGLVGPIINIIIFVKWTWEITDPALTLTYRGLALGNFMFGSMDQTGEYNASGIWYANKAAAGAASAGDASILIKAPQ